MSWHSLRWLLILFLINWRPVHCQDSLHWKTIQKLKKGQVTVYWFPNEPFGFRGKDGQLQGIEIEIMMGFKRFLKDHHQVDLSIKWIEQHTFKNVMDHIKNASVPGIFGVAGFSFTPERREFMKFSPSYMVDMAVLVSTQDIPIIRSKEDLKKYFSGATALTAQGTILEKELLQLRDENQLNFNIEYTGGSEELIKIITQRKKSFGYLNLPIYLIELDKGLSKLNRQNFLTKRYEGRGIGLAKVSDWDIPINEYFESPEFKSQIESLIGKYIDIELYHFIETLQPENEISLLNQEKSLQLMQLNLQELTIKDKNQKQVYLITVVVVVCFFLVVIGYQFRKLRQRNLLLKEQKDEIEAQAEHIQSINNNLERLVNERTQELQNKNRSLEEYAFITAHRLRAPLASIMGLVILIEKMQWLEKDKVIIDHLRSSSKNLDKIIHEAMDVISRSTPSGEQSKDSNS